MTQAYSTPLVDNTDLYFNMDYTTGGGGGGVNVIQPSYLPAAPVQTVPVNFNQASPLTVDPPLPGSNLPTANPGPLQTIQSNIPVTPDPPGPINVAKSNAWLTGLILAGGIYLLTKEKRKKRR